MQKKIEALSNAYDYINKLENGIISVSDSINGGNEENGVSLIPVICDGIEWLIQVINLTRDIQKKEISIDELNKQLSQIVEALENEDYILVGDLFNYEMIPVLNNIQKEISLTIN